jgi:SAM-dependent methyltransferase
MNTTEQMKRSFLEEYNSPSAIVRYSTATAGHGINYLIEHDYAGIYDKALTTCRRTSPAPLRLLEFGCGAGMNLINLLSRCARRGIMVDAAYGTDFSAALIESATRDACAFLPPALRERVRFQVARNEALTAELALATGRDEKDMRGSLDFIFGVNTFRYCHRLGTAQQCADDIYRLLRPGGATVMIDMNDRFPLFRSRLWGPTGRLEETYVPSLDEYARPFEQAGFEISRKDHFCWIPHSAGHILTGVCRVLTPILNATIRSRAMRSVVVATKPL